jgi:hypothetical protein
MGWIVVKPVVAREHPVADEVVTDVLIGCVARLYRATSTRREIMQFCTAVSF